MGADHVFESAAESPWGRLCTNHTASIRFRDSADTPPAYKIAPIKKSGAHISGLFVEAFLLPGRRKKQLLAPRSCPTKLKSTSGNLLGRSCSAFFGAEFTDHRCGFLKKRGL